ncbi:hypothetical protein GBA52_010598, partial [Prunus armeniaca]
MQDLLHDAIVGIEGRESLNKRQAEEVWWKGEKIAGEKAIESIGYVDGGRLG